MIGLLFVVSMLGVLAACWLLTWWCVLPPCDFSADDFEIGQQLEGRAGDDAGQA